MPASLYVHIPFCLKRCVYCDFVSGIYDAAKVSVYIEALKKEISNIPDNNPMSTLFIGGGTPTALPAEAVTALIKHIFSRFQFAKYYEATIEANPGTVDNEKLSSIRSSGINRISIGIQSFNEAELDLLGRIHSGEDAEQAVHLARNAGFKNIGIDLIYGIPGQSIFTWRATLEKAVKLKPAHISTYELTVEHDTTLYDFINSNKLKKIEEDKIIEMYEHTIDFLTAHGYIHYEISNFALPGYQCRHNLNYWDRGEYYGAGLGAHSFISGKRFHNTDHLEDYLKLIPEGRSPVKGTEYISDEKALPEAIFLGLRKTEGINLKTFSERYGIDMLRNYGKEIVELQAAGLIELTGSNSLNHFLKLTPKGILLSNEVFAKFI